MATRSSTLAWKILRTEEPGRLQSMGLLRVRQRLHFHFSLSCIGEGNGNPLQCSCLENPRDGRAWRAAIYGVAQSRTRLKRLSSSCGIWDLWLWHVGSSSLIRNGNQVPCIGIVRSYPLDHQGSPLLHNLINDYIINLCYILLFHMYNYREG